MKNTTQTSDDYRVDVDGADWLKAHNDAWEDAIAESQAYGRKANEEY